MIFVWCNKVSGNQIKTTMPSITRKKFLQTTALFCGAIVTHPYLHFMKQYPLLSFSTLGCPDWTFQQITDFAVQHGYSGIELRGIQRQMDLTQCPQFNTEAARKTTLAAMKEKGLQFVNLGSSANLHFAEGAERQKNISEAKKFIDLAQQINCPYIRVFPNNFPKDQDRNTTLQLISKGLAELGNYAKGKNVVVLMETHGEVVQAADIATIMQSAQHPQVGLVWDIANMWTITKEPPAEVYQHLKQYIRHTHIKDAKLIAGKPEYTLLGQGDVPIFEAVDALRKGGYGGYYSFEWEKLWHPEIADPQIALADYPIAVKKYFNRL